MPQIGQPPWLMHSVSVMQQHPYPLPAGSSTLAIQTTPNHPVVASAQGVTIVVSIDIKFRDGGGTRVPGYVYLQLQLHFFPLLSFPQLTNRRSL